MPLFFILSGYLFKNKKEVASYGKRLVRKYIIPYFILCTVNLFLVVIIDIIFDRDLNIGKYIVGILYSRGTTEWMPNCSPLWFLTCITIALFIYNRIMHINIAGMRVSLIIIAAAISFILDKVNVPKLPWNVDTALMSLFFILVGQFLYKHDKLLNLDILLYVLLAALGVFATYLNPETVNFDDNEYGNLLLMLIAASTLSIFVIALAKHFNPFPRLIGFWGRHTLFIMGFDYFSGMVVSRITENFLLLFLGKMILLTVGILIWNKIISVISNSKLKEVLSF